MTKADATSTIQNPRTQTSAHSVGEWAWDLTLADGLRQQWVQRDASFVKVRLPDVQDGGAPVEIVLDGDAEEGLPDRLRAARCCGLLPGPFAHCPFCGRPATPPPPRPDDGAAAAAWSQALATGSATLPATQLSTPSAGAGSAVDAAKRGSLPSTGPFLFTMGGSPPFTVAVDMTSGVVWRPESGDWRRLTAVGGACALPAWSLAAAPLGTGIVVPQDDGAAWAEIDGPLRRYVRFSGGPAVGGAIAVNGMALVPVRADGRLAVAWTTDSAARDGAAWLVSPVTNAEAAGDGILGKPMSSLPGAAVWAGADGFLSVRTGPEGPLAIWREWPAGCRGLPWSRPHIGEHAIAHQLVRRDDRSGYMAIAMPAPNARGLLPDTVQSVRVDGPYVTTGEVAFYMHLRCRGLPWRRSLGEFTDPGSIVLPLMAFSRAATAGSGEHILYATVQDARVVTGDDGGGPPTERRKATLFLFRPGLTVEPLLSGLPVSTLHDLQPFLLDGQLCLYDANGGAWHRWTLSPAPVG